jgi:hypothetical protein
VSTSVRGDEGVTGHYGGGPLGGFPWDHSRCPTIWRAWQAYHMSPGGLGVPSGGSDLAYSLGACIHGFVFEGRGVGVRTAANGTTYGNDHSYAVVYMAGAGEPLTDAGKVAFLDARALLMGGPRPANSDLYPHDHWKLTECPGDVKEWIRQGAPSPVLVWAPPANPAMSAPLADLAETPSGHGYIEVDEKGGVYTFGDAMFFGSLPGLGVVPNHPIVAAEISPSGGGYWIVAADGGVFAFGDAPYLGGLGGVALNAPVVAFEASPTGAGYRMAGADGGVFCFGDATYEGRASW